MKHDMRLHLVLDHYLRPGCTCGWRDKGLFTPVTSNLDKVICHRFDRHAADPDRCSGHVYYTDEGDPDYEYCTHGCVARPNVGIDT